MGMNLHRRIEGHGATLPAALAPRLVVTSIGMPISCGWPLSKQIDKAIPELFDDLRFDLRRLQLTDGVDAPLAVREIKHEHVVQFCESRRIGCAAHRSVFLENALDNARIKDSHLT